MGVRVSASSLAAAVSQEGGLGVIAAVALGEVSGTAARDFRARSRAALVQSIRQTREKTGNPFGVNIMCALTNYEDLVAAAAEEGVAVIISGAGLPLKLPALVRNRTTKLVPIVSSARAIRLICSVWQRRYARLPDAVIVEGPLAGGHLGYSRQELDSPAEVYLDRILQEVLAAVRDFSAPGQAIPVIAAGGIYDGADIARVMGLGASGVQMATRFVCTHECDADIRYKNAYLSARPEEVVIIQSPVGMPGRVLRNAFVDRITAGERIDFGCEYQCLSTCDPRKVNYCIARALINASHGDLDHGFAMCGSNVHRVREIVSVKSLVCELTNAARECLVCSGEARKTEAA